MKDLGPEFKNTNKEGNMSFGYTVARIKAFTPAPRTPIHTDHKDGLHKEAIKGREMTALEVKMETAEMATMFIPYVWQKIC